MGKVDGGKEKLAAQVERYADRVLRLALACLGNLADAQDVCQDVFIKLYRHDPSFADAEHEKAWILRVTINACRDVLRSPWRKWFSPVERLPDNRTEGGDEVVSFVLALPRKYRTVIHLYYYEGYQTAEISRLLNMKESSVRTRLRRARELLRKSMEGEEEDSDEIQVWERDEPHSNRRRV